MPGGVGGAGSIPVPTRFGFFDPLDERENQGSCLRIDISIINYGSDSIFSIRVNIAICQRFDPVLSLENEQIILAREA